MSEFITLYREELNLVLGAAIAYLGFFIQARASSQQSKKQLFLEKIERCYALCQLVYDGHKREITNATKNFMVNKELYLSNRNHPGQEMSELRMILRCYVPKLTKFEAEFDKSHKSLKDEIFRMLDDAVLTGQSIELNEFEAEMRRCDSLLNQLAKVTSELKVELAKQANTFVK